MDSERAWASRGVDDDVFERDGSALPGRGANINLVIVNHYAQLRDRLWVKISRTMRTSSGKRSADSVVLLGAGLLGGPDRAHGRFASIEYCN